jgi:hypothetical protein
VGEAKRKRDHQLDLDARGIVRPRDPWCPACGSKRTHDMPLDSIPFTLRTDAHIDCGWMMCLDCAAVWEPFPESYVRDPVCAELCNNCAFRPGSSEQQDKVKWKALIDSLHPDAEYGHFRGQFFCHKGVPIDMSRGPGNFLFPMKPVLLDGEPVKNPDGSTVMTQDTSKMRTCSGFLRFVWAINAKREKAAP